LSLVSWNRREDEEISMHSHEGPSIVVTQVRRRGEMGGLQLGGGGRLFVRDENPYHRGKGEVGEESRRPGEESL